MKKNSLFLIFLIIFVLGIMGYTYVKQKFMYIVHPLKYEQFIVKYSIENNVDPHLVMALICVESGYNVDATSKANAKGLMQLVDNTAIGIAKKQNMLDFNVDDLYNPEVNIKFGIYYFKELLDTFHGNKYLAIIAYNAGVNRVKDWITKGVISENIDSYENIPYPETKGHLKKVIREYKIYKQLYVIGE